MRRMFEAASASPRVFHATNKAAIVHRQGAQSSARRNTAECCRLRALRSLADSGQDKHWRLKKAVQWAMINDQRPMRCLWACRRRIGLGGFALFERAVVFSRAAPGTLADCILDERVSI